MKILNRDEMKNILAGSSDGCGPYCEGCLIDNTSSGFPCIEWKCNGDNFCYPKNSYCCVAVGEN